MQLAFTYLVVKSVMKVYSEVMFFMHTVFLGKGVRIAGVELPAFSRKGGALFSLLHGQQRHS